MLKLGCSFSPVLKFLTTRLDDCVIFFCEKNGRKQLGGHGLVETVCQTYLRLAGLGSSKKLPRLKLRKWLSAISTIASELQLWSAREQMAFQSILHCNIYALDLRVASLRLPTYTHINHPRLNFAEDERCDVNNYQPQATTAPRLGLYSKCVFPMQTLARDGWPVTFSNNAKPTLWALVRLCCGLLINKSFGVNASRSRIKNTFNFTHCRRCNFTESFNFKSQDLQFLTVEQYSSSRLEYVNVCQHLVLLEYIRCCVKYLKILYRNRICIVRENRLQSDFSVQ